MEGITKTASVTTWRVPAIVFFWVRESICFIWRKIWRKFIFIFLMRWLNRLNLLFSFVFLGEGRTVWPVDDRHRIDPSKYYPSGAEPRNTIQGVICLVDLQRIFRDSFAKVPQKQCRKRAPVRLLEGGHNKIPACLTTRHGWLSVKEKTHVQSCRSLALTFSPLTPICRIHSFGRLRWWEAVPNIPAISSLKWSRQVMMMRWGPWAGMHCAMTFTNDCDACLEKNMRWILHNRIGPMPNKNAHEFYRPSVSIFGR